LLFEVDKLSMNQDGLAATHTLDVVTLIGGTVLIISRTALEQLLLPKIS
jgi:hypothetical protein